VVAFTPDGNTRRTLNDWKSSANRFHWIVYASNDFSDAAITYSIDPVAQTILTHLNAAEASLPVDTSHVLLAGFSGGGFMAEDLAARVPDLARAVVVDANGYFSKGHGTEFPLAQGDGRPAAFLYSPQDLLFGAQTQAESAVYQAHGWSTLVLSYPGGHEDAPQSRYFQVAAWINAQPSWKLGTTGSETLGPLRFAPISSPRAGPGKSDFPPHHAPLL
jgi:pimeloyl-ACP methyl ester carboxylesterase